MNESISNLHLSNPAVQFSSFPFSLKRFYFQMLWGFSKKKIFWNFRKERVFDHRSDVFNFFLQNKNLFVWEFENWSKKKNSEINFQKKHNKKKFFQQKLRKKFLLEKNCMMPQNIKYSPHSLFIRFEIWKANIFSHFYFIFCFFLFVLVLA